MVIGVKSGERRKRSDVLDPQAVLQAGDRLSGVETYENYTGFGLYDRKVMEIMKSSTIHTPTSAA